MPDDINIDWHYIDSVCPSIIECQMVSLHILVILHDDVIKWKHFPRYWPFVRGIHRSPVNSPHKGQWRGALMFSLICVWINGWVNNGEAGDLRHYRAHYDVTVMNNGDLNTVLIRDDNVIVLSKDIYGFSFNNSVELEPFKISTKDEIISIHWDMWPLLITWINLNSSMDK